MLFQDAQQEQLRHAALLELGLLTEPIPLEFVQLCERARDHFRVVSAMVKVIDGDTVFVKAHAGPALRELPRHEAFSDYTIRSDEVFVVEDALEDPLFARSPLVQRERPIRFYAGAPLIFRQNIRLGSFCLFDTRPRAFSLGDRAELAATADELVSGLIWRDVAKGAQLLH